MEISERLCICEEQARHLEKRLDGICLDTIERSKVNTELFGKLIDRMNTLILVTIVLSIMAGMNILESILKLTGVLK